MENSVGLVLGIFPPNLGASILYIGSETKGVELDFADWWALLDCGVGVFCFALHIGVFSLFSFTPSASTCGDDDNIVGTHNCESISPVGLSSSTMSSIWLETPKERNLLPAFIHR